jgi:MSHA biogenesis protein MshN
VAKAPAKAKPVSRPVAAAPAAKPVKPAAPKPVAAAKGREETPAQRAENAYRRALASLEDGRVTEAIAGLQAALKADPRHEASRQALVSLLIEAKRPDEALRQLGAALALDPRQPAMAMLMARLQIERGSPGVDTLLRTLPYAAGNAEYHAFLAAALAREGRNREAVEHYQAALRTTPQNGVWWMGLGIALQAEKRNPEAAGAFQKALDSGSLSAELQGFVERKLKQLAR